MRRHRGRELRAFPDAVERAVPADLDIHIVMDDASGRKARLIRDRFVRRPRRRRRFTPTSASWLNQVERFFALLTERQIQARRASLRRRPRSRHRALLRNP